MDSDNEISEDLPLSHSPSLAWQERWSAGVQDGIDDANRGDFADEDDIAAVLNRFGQS